MSQPQYVLDISCRFGMLKCKPIITPMCAAGSQPDESSESDQKLYEQMEGSLLFLATRNQPDISSAVNPLCQKMLCRLQYHMVAAKTC